MRPLHLVLQLPALLSLSLFVGCSATTTTMPGGPQSGDHAVTFHKDIEPLLQKHCQNCHSPGHIAPFSLVTYQDAKPVAGLMVAQTRARTMPPWGAFSTDGCKPRFGWQDDKRLTDAEIALFESWNGEGAPEGDMADAPPPFTPPPDGLPGVQRTLGPQKPFPAGGNTDQFQCFVLNPGFTQAMHLNGWHTVAGNPRVVHHALVFATTDQRVLAMGGADGNYPCFGGPGVDATLISAWAPGSLPAQLPQNVATTLPANTLFVMQVHYHPAGLTGQTDATQFQMRFLPQPPEYQFLVSLIGNFDRRENNGDGLQPDENGVVQFRIPANDGHKVIEQVFTIPEIAAGLPLPEMHIFNVGTHMHYVGRDMRIDIERGPTITNDDPQRECLIEEPEWDFNWQRWYVYDADIDKLPRAHSGDRLRMTCVYDNTLANPFVATALRQQGLDAPRDVYLGESTLDEMCLGVFGSIYKP